MADPVFDHPTPVQQEVNPGGGYNLPYLSPLQQFPKMEFVPPQQQGGVQAKPFQNQLGSEMFMGQKNPAIAAAELVGPLAVAGLMDIAKEMRQQAPPGAGSQISSSAPLSAAKQTAMAPTVQNQLPSMSSATSGLSRIPGSHNISPLAGLTSRTVTQPFIGPSGSTQLGMSPNYVGGQQNMGLYTIIVALQRMTDTIINTVNRTQTVSSPVSESSKQQVWSTTLG